MKVKHFLISILSASFICIPVILQSDNAPIKKNVTHSVKIYEPNKESIISEIPDYIIEAKSLHSKAFILLDDEKIPVYIQPSSVSQTTDYITDAKPISILESTEEWYKILYDKTKTGYVLKKHTTENEQKAISTANAFIIKKSIPAPTAPPPSEPNPDKGQEVVECAKKYLGVKYVYGGSSPSGFDCSGLVQFVCKSVGISVNRTAASQFNNGRAVNKNELLPGDLLFFAKSGRIHHVGIYAGDGKMIHAPHTGEVVKFSDFNTPYRQREFVGARRIF